MVASDAFLGDLLFPGVSLAVGVILFEGGLTLDLRELRSIGTSLFRILAIGIRDYDLVIVLNR